MPDFLVEEFAMKDSPKRTTLGFESSGIIRSALNLELSLLAIILFWGFCATLFLLSTWFGLTKGFKLGCFFS